MLFRGAVVLLVLASSNALILTQTRTLAVAPLAASRNVAVFMGRGDKRTKKGKIKAKSFGVCRPTNGKLRRDRDGPMAVAPTMAVPVAAAAPVEEPVVVAEEPVVEEPVAEEPVAEVEPPAAELTTAEIAARVKELLSQLPR